MFKIEKLNIKLERENGVFHSGETIVGSFDFSVNTQTFAQSIRLILDGFSSFSMYEKKSNNGIRKIEGYTPYLKFFINFLPIENQQATLLNPGDYSYRFEIKLPDNLPPSFIHGSFGETSYSLTGIIDIPWSTSKRVEKPFYVLDISDLNEHTISRYWRKPRDTRSQKFYGCLCCKSAPLNLLLGTINKNSFIPGETISFRIKLDNESSRTIKSMKVLLYRTITYNLAKNSKRQFFKQMAKWEHKFERDPGEHFSLEDGTIQIPENCLPSQESETRLIQIEYELRLHVFSSFFTTRSLTKLPIKIGNVQLDPLREEQSVLSHEDIAVDTPVVARPYYDIKTIDETFVRKLIKV